MNGTFLFSLYFEIQFFSFKLVADAFVASPFFIFVSHDDHSFYDTLSPFFLSKVTYICFTPRLLITQAIFVGILFAVVAMSTGRIMVVVGE